MSEQYCPNLQVTVVDQSMINTLELISTLLSFPLQRSRSRYYVFLNFMYSAIFKMRKFSFEFANCSSISIFHYLKSISGCPSMISLPFLFCCYRQSVSTAPTFVDSHLVVLTVSSKKAIEKHLINSI